MSVIASMLEERREEQKAAEKRRQKEIKERTESTLKQAHAAVEETLGEVYAELNEANPDAKGKYSTADDGLVKSLWWEDVTWDGMPPFRLSARAVASRSRYAAENAGTWSGEYGIFLAYHGDKPRAQFEQQIEREKDVAVFFARLDEERKQQETKALRDQIGRLEGRLTGNHPVETEKEAREIVEKMKALAPDFERLVGPQEHLVEGVDKAFARWQGWRQGKDERQIRVAKNRRNLAAYEAALRQWDAQWEAADQRNRERLKRLKERFREKVSVYDLYYAEVAVDHDMGDRFVNVRRVDVLDDRPSHDGYWTVLEYGKIRRIRYENVVKIEGPVRKYVGLSVDSGHHAIGSITCAPGMEDEARKRLAEVAGHWEEKPPMPKPEAFGMQEGAYYDIGGHNDYRLADYNIRELANHEREPQFARAGEV